MINKNIINKISTVSNKVFLGILISALSVSHAYADWKTSAKQKGFNKLESALNKNLDNTEVSIKSTERNKPEFEILTVQPILDKDNSITFFQGSALRHDGDRETVNLGLGHRLLLNDDTLLVGLNAFYDHEFDYSHKRSSIGAEVRSSVFEFNSNMYFAESNERTGKNSNTEEALDGKDFEIGGHVPYIPTWKFFAKQFEFQVPGANDYQGQEYSTEILIPNTGLTLTTGVKNYDHHNDNWYFEFTYNLGKVNPYAQLIQDQAYQLVSMGDKKLEKVRRENVIVKKIGSGFSVSASGF